MRTKKRMNRLCVSIGRPIDGRPVISGMICVSLAGLISRFLSGSPLRMLHLVGVKQSLPPTWIFFLVWLCFYAVLGFCFGAVLGSHALGREVHKYKGSFYFVIMMVFNIIWYPLFFKAGAIFISLIDIIFIMLFCFIAATEYMSVRRSVGIAMLIHLVWLAYCFILNLSVFLKT